MERYPLTGHFYISLDISVYLKGPKEERPSMFPQNCAHMETDAHSRALSNTSFGVPRKEPSLQVPFMESLPKEMPRS